MTKNDHIAMRRSWSVFATGMEQLLGLQRNTPIPEILNRSTEIADALSSLIENLQSARARFGFNTLEEFYEAVSDSETE